MRNVGSCNVTLQNEIYIHIYIYIHGTCDMGQPNVGTHEMAKPFEGQEGPDGPPWVSLMDPRGFVTSNAAF